MTDLRFSVAGAGVCASSPAPTLAMDLHIATASPLRVESILLGCQVQIEAARRSYTLAEQRLLNDLFGEPERWRETLGPLQWTRDSIRVPSFQGAIAVPLLLPCAHELGSGVAKYFGALEGGAAPLSLLFRGTVFSVDGSGGVQVTPIAWDSEARFQMPVSLWRAAMAAPVVQ